MRPMAWRLDPRRSVVPAAGGLDLRRSAYTPPEHPGQPMTRHSPAPGKFIAKAITRPGALRAKAKRAKLITGDEPLTEKDLATLAKGGTTRTKKQVALARTLRTLGRRRR